MAVQNINGIDLKLKVNGIELGCAQAINLNVKTATSKAVCRGDGGWEQSIAGRHSWGTDTSGLIRFTSGSDVATNVTYNDLLALQKARALVTVVFGTAIVGDTIETGTAIITDIKATSPLDGAATFTVTLEGSGPLVASVNA